MVSKQTKPLYEFGPYRLDVAEQRLLRNGQLVPLPPKVFDTLLMLVERGGRMIEKDELMTRLWPDTFVGEAALARNISDLRKALGEGPGGQKYIETVPKRGYRFMAGVKLLPSTALIVERHTRSRVVIEEEIKAGTPVKSVAVLPFTPLGANVGDEYFGLGMADALITYKYIIKNVARKHGLSATFMPKPLFEDNGSGMHTHQSLWKNGETIMFDEAGYAGLSEAARYYIGGLLKHAPALLAFAAPTTNSYRRLVPGYEAPINLVYSQRNRSAICRIPMYSGSPKAKRIEFRAPDPSCNPYLCFAALLMAGLDGIQNRIDPGAPIDKDLYDLPPDEAAEITNTPGSLSDVLDALEADHEFLLKGDVFTTDLIEAYVEYKREAEIDPVRLRPHPHEFALYFDI